METYYHPKDLAKFGDMGEEEICGLQIPVDDAGGVCFRQSVDDLQHVLDGFADR